MEADMIKEDLNRLGMKVQLQGVTFNVHISRVHETKDWEAHLGAWGAGTDPHGVNALWKSNGIYHFFDLNPTDTTPTHWNYPWEKRIDELYNKGAITVDPAKRKVIYNEFQHLVAEQQPLIFFPVFLYTVAVRDNVGNVNPSAYSSLGVSWNSYELYKK
jgi:peptide/nickel transport system substrate-binding protein